MIRSYSISSSPTEREYVQLSIRREPRVLEVTEFQLVVVAHMAPDTLLR